jgi:ABC-type multidrug transport system ATPase subunit
VVTFENITFTVLEKKTKTPKRILDGITGIFRPNSLNYLMGPSGAGKSTLLDALAGRLPGKDTSGSVRVNGIELEGWQFRAIAKYVQQEDVLTPSLTARETLVYAALFFTTNYAEAEGRADRALDQLGLQKQRDTRVGNAIIKGLSGGQKRRLSVGVELVAKPKILFLDEPTSGLDSTSAAHVVKALRRISHEEGTTMALTIHQPAQMLMQMSDGLVLLSAGKAAYAGPTSQAITHMTSIGYPLPPTTSTSEYLLDLVNADFSDPETVDKILTAWPGTPLGIANAEAAASAGKLGRRESTVDQAKSALVPTHRYAIPFTHQYKTLVSRGFKDMFRNPLVIWLRMALYGALSFMIGTVWLQIGVEKERNVTWADGSTTMSKEPRADVVQDIANSLFFIGGFMVFMSVAVQIAYIEEKAIFKKERASGQYSVGAYQLAHLTVEIPFLLLLSFVCSAICYWLMGLNNEAGDGGRFGFFILDLFLSFMVAESMMVLIAALVPVAIAGIAAGAMMFGAFMVVQGFFIKLEKIGWWWRWMHYLALHSYAFKAFMDNEFRGRKFPEGKLNGVVIPEISGGDVLKSYGYEDVDKWACMGALIIMVVVYRLLATLVMGRW